MFFFLGGGLYKGRSIVCLFCLFLGPLNLLRVFVVFDVFRLGEAFKRADECRRGASISAKRADGGLCYDL